MAYSCAADGSITIPVFVDESPPADVVANPGTWSRNHLLRLPSGRLVFTGVEYVPRPGRVADASHRGARDGAWSEIAIAPGDYALDVFERTYDEARDDDDEVGIDDETAVRVGRANLESVDRVGGAIGCLAVITALAVFFFLLPLFSGYRDVFWLVAPWLVPALLVAWLVAIALWRRPVTTRVEHERQKVRDEHERRHPALVVVLRKLRDDEPRPTRGALCGIGLSSSERNTPRNGPRPG